MDGTTPTLEDLAIEITIDSPDSPERVEKLRQAWLRRCPVYLALVMPAHVEVTWASPDGEGATTASLKRSSTTF